MNIDTLKDKFESIKTFANVKSMVKKFNELLGIAPVNYLHPHEYDARFDELVQAIITSRTARNKQELVNKMQALVNVISKFDAHQRGSLRPGEAPGILTTGNSGLRAKIIAMRKSGLELPTSTPYDAVPWAEMLASINDELEHNPNRNAKVACVFFKHGYCNSLGDILATATCAGNEYNHLDMDALTWTVRGTVIPVSAEFVAELSKFIEIKDFLLIYKTTGEKYRTTLLSSIGIDSFKMHDIKNSYGTRMNEPEPVLTCDAHPLHIEDPDKYSVDGKIKIRAKPRALVKTDTMEVWSSGSE